MKISASCSLSCLSLILPTELTSSLSVFRTYLHQSHTTIPITTIAIAAPKAAKVNPKDEEIDKGRLSAKTASAALVTIAIPSVTWKLQ